MGDIIKKITCTGGIKEKEVELYFDSGSPFTFIKISTGREIGSISKLIKPQEFKGIGNGKFTADYMTQIHIKLLDIYCPHLCYVIDDELLEQDILVGHDFMQRYDIKLDLQNRDIIVEKSALLRGMRIHLRKPSKFYPIEWPTQDQRF